MNIRNKVFWFFLSRGIFLSFVCAYFLFSNNGVAKQNTNVTVVPMQQVYSDIPEMRAVRKANVCYMDIGDDYYKNGDYEMALENYKRAIEIDSSDHELDLYIQAGIVSSKLGNYDDAVDCYKVGLQKFPDSSFAHIAKNNLAYIYAEFEENLYEAMFLIHDALEVDPENSAYLDTKGWILFKCGNVYQAKEYLDRAQANNRYNEVIKGHLTEIDKMIEQLASLVQRF